MLITNKQNSDFVFTKELYITIIETLLELLKKIILPIYFFLLYILLYTYILKKKKNLKFL
jgi:hypothetical protein